MANEKTEGATRPTVAPVAFWCRRGLEIPYPSCLITTSAGHFVKNMHTLERLSRKMEFCNVRSVYIENPAVTPPEWSNRRSS